jgi:hypothetical protein
LRAPSLNWFDPLLPAADALVLDERAPRSAIPSEVIDFPLQRGWAHPLLAPLIRFHRSPSAPHARPLPIPALI